MMLHFFVLAVKHIILRYRIPSSAGVGNFPLEMTCNAVLRPIMSVTAEDKVSEFFDH
jgi:hypothetical protein